MAKQEGFSTYSGKLGDKVGFRRGKKFFERKNTDSYQPPAESLKSASEFGNASKASAIFRKAFAHLLIRSFMPNIHMRLTKLFGQVICSGPQQKKGERQVSDGDLTLLKNFKFNSYKGFGDLSDLKLSSNIQDGYVNMTILPFKNSVERYLSEYRAKICISFAWFDFAKQNYEVINSNPLYLKTDEEFEGRKLKIPIPKQHAFTLIIFATICFENDPDGKGLFVTSGNRRYQAGAILEAMHFIDGVLQTFVPDIVETNAVKEEDPDVDIYWE